MLAAIVASLESATNSTPPETQTTSWGALDRLRAPSGANVFAFAVLFAISVAFLFVAYCLSRALFGGFGGGFGTITACVASTAARSIFL